MSAVTIQQHDHALEEVSEVDGVEKRCPSGHPFLPMLRQDEDVSDSDEGVANALAAFCVCHRLAREWPTRKAAEGRNPA